MWFVDVAINAGPAGTPWFDAVCCFGRSFLVCVRPCFKVASRCILCRGRYEQQWPPWWIIITPIMICSTSITTSQSQQPGDLPAARNTHLESDRGHCFGLSCHWLAAGPLVFPLEIHSKRRRGGGWCRTWCWIHRHPFLVLFANPPSQKKTLDDLDGHSCFCRRLVNYICSLWKWKTNRKPTLHKRQILPQIKFTLDPWVVFY